MLKYVNHDIVFSEFPDEVTLAVNLSLCPNGCPGCHSSYLQGDVGDELTETRLLALVDGYLGAVTCVGLMGGDNDPVAVRHLCRRLKQLYGPALRTGWYSGRSRLPAGFSGAALSEAFDYVKLGPSRRQLGPLSSSGTNQRLYRVQPDGSMEDITARFWRH